MKKKIELTEEQKQEISDEKLREYAEACEKEVTDFEFKMMKEIDLIREKWNRKKDKLKVVVKYAYYEDEDEEVKKVKQVKERKEWTNEDKHKLIIFYTQNDSFREIAKKMDRTEGSCHQQVDKLKNDSTFKQLFSVQTFGQERTKGRGKVKQVIEEVKEVKEEEK